MAHINWFMMRGSLIVFLPKLRKNLPLKLGKNPPNDLPQDSKQTIHK